jgi:hypothetical protein
MAIARSQRLAGLVAMCLALTPALAGAAPVAEIEKRRAAQRTAFSDAEILDGFFKVTIGAEFQTRAPTDRIRKFDGPVRVFIDSQAKPDRAAETAEVVADIGRRVGGLTISVVPQRAEANVIVTLVRDRDMPKAIERVYGKERGRSIQRSLDPQCLSGFRKDDTFRIQFAEVILVVDRGADIFLDCAYEEILQALGPINDTDVPWTMFNDDVSLGFFGVYDQLLLNLLYHPKVRPGMTRSEAAAVMPEILPEVRAFVSEGNGLKR